MPGFNSFQLESRDTNMAISEQGAWNKMIEPKMYEFFFFPANFRFFSNINEIIKLWDTKGHQSNKNLPES